MGAKLPNHMIDAHILFFNGLREWEFQGTDSKERRESMREEERKEMMLIFLLQNIDSQLESHGLLKEP